MFGYGIDKKTLYIVAGILVIISLFSYGTDGIIDLLLSVPAVLIAITVHEFGHAFAAYREEGGMTSESERKFPNFFISKILSENNGGLDFA